MPKLSDFITYRTDGNVKAAFLRHCRKLDLHDGSGIPKGAIIQGEHGFVAAEADVPKVGGTVVPFTPNGQCTWQGRLLPCQYLPGSPSRKQLRCRNYIVAAVPEATVEAALKAAGLPVIETQDGKKLVNLETDRGSWQAKERRATLA